MTRRIAVHPNSTAARKWGRTAWTTTLPDSARVPGAGRAVREKELRAYFRIAALAARRGDTDLASRLRAAGMRARQTTLHCG